MNKHIVLYDFTRKPSVTFYRILKDEFGITAGSPEHVQRSVLIVRDDLEAYGNAALIEEFGGDALVYKISDNPDSSQLIEQARARITRIRRQRGTAYTDVEEIVFEALTELAGQLEADDVETPALLDFLGEAFRYQRRYDNFAARRRSHWRRARPGLASRGPRPPHPQDSRRGSYHHLRDVRVAGL